MRGEVPTDEGPAGVVGNPVRFVGEERAPLGAPPGFGEHTDDALRAAGYDDAAIAELRSAGVV